MLPASNATEVEGAGIGLALVQLLSDRMGATVTFSSAEGLGSVFTLIIPLKRSPLQLSKKQFAQAFAPPAAAAPAGAESPWAHYYERPVDSVPPPPSPSLQPASPSPQEAARPAKPLTRQRTTDSVVSADGSGIFFEEAADTRTDDSTDSRGPSRRNSLTVVYTNTPQPGSVLEEEDPQHNPSSGAASLPRSSDSRIGQPLPDQGRASSAAPAAAAPERLPPPVQVPPSWGLSGDVASTGAKRLSLPERAAAVVVAVHRPILRVRERYPPAATRSTRLRAHHLAPYRMDRSAIRPLSPSLPCLFSFPIPSLSSLMFSLRCPLRVRSLSTLQDGLVQMLSCVGITATFRPVPHQSDRAGRGSVAGLEIAGGGSSGVVQGVPLSGATFRAALLGASASSGSNGGGRGGVASLTGPAASGVDFDLGGAGRAAPPMPELPGAEDTVVAIMEATDLVEILRKARILHLPNLARTCVHACCPARFLGYAVSPLFIPPLASRARCLAALRPRARSSNPPPHLSAEHGRTRKSCWRLDEEEESASLLSGTITSSVRRSWQLRPRRCRARRAPAPACR